MNANEIVEQLRVLGKESYKNVLLKHGIPEPVFGVSVEELKKFQKQIKKNYQLALDLFETGIYDAMYLAGLIADEKKMRKQDLQRWLALAHCNSLREYSVAWVTADSGYGWELGLEWIASKEEATAATGWASLASWVALMADADLDLAELKILLGHVRETIHAQDNRVRSCMNGFVIAVGAYVAALTEFSMELGRQIGPVQIDVGDTACKVPFSPDAIAKVQARGSIGKKRKTSRC